MRPPFGGEIGSSFLEVIVAMGLTTVSLGLMMTSAGNGVALTGTLQHRFHASVAANYLAQSLLAAEPNNPNLAPGTHKIQCGYNTCPETGGPLEATWLVTPDTPQVGLTQIEVNVRWLELQTPRTARAMVYRRAP